MWVSVPAGGRVAVDVSVSMAVAGDGGREEKNKAYIRFSVGTSKGCGEEGRVESSDSR